ncbi:MAG: hypothetical protein QM796_10380 [Chthoniobacteraceae bacterium]
MNDAVSAGGNASLTSANGVTVKAAVSTTNGDLTLGTNAGTIATTAGGTLSAGGNLSVVAPDAVAINDDAAAKGTMLIKATVGAVEVAVDAKLTTSRTGAMTITAGTDVAVGNVAAGGDLTVTAGDDFAMHDNTTMTVHGQRRASSAAATWRRGDQRPRQCYTADRPRPDAERRGRKPPRHARRQVAPRRRVDRPALPVLQPAVT